MHTKTINISASSSGKIISAILKNTGTFLKQQELQKTPVAHCAQGQSRQAHVKRKTVNPEQKKMQKKSKSDSQNSKEAKRLDYFSAGHTTSAKLHQAEEDYARKHPLKGELICKSRGKPSAHHSCTSEAVFDHVYLHLVLSDYLSTTELQNLNACNMLYEHLCKMMNHINLNLVYDLFDYDLDYMKQEEIPFKRSMQYLFLALVHKLHVPSMIRSLKGNHTAIHRDPEKILENFKSCLDEDLHKHLERVLNNKCPAKFIGHTTASQRKASREYGNHPSMKANSLKVKKAMNKEEKNKFVMVMPIWLERFIPHLHLTPQGILIRKGKKDRIFSDNSFLISPEAACTNQFTFPHCETELEYGSAFTRHLTQIYNLRVTYPKEEIFLFDDDVSGAFKHIKYHPDIAAAHSFKLDKSLYIPLGSTFGSNVSPQEFEVIAKARVRKAEELQTLPCMKEIEERHKELINLIKFPADAFKCENKITPATADKVNKGVLLNGKRGPTKNTMFVDDNLMADTWEYLKPALAASAEALFMLLDYPNEKLRKSPLSMDKYYESLCSYTRKQLGKEINTRKLIVTITEARRLEILNLLLTGWHDKRKSFTLREAVELLSILCFVAQDCPFANICSFS